jgi:hypothetical protein
MKKLLSFILLGVLFMGAKGCNDCEKMQSAAAAACAAMGVDSTECKQAKAEAEKTCTTTTTTTTTMPQTTCADGLPPIDGKCPTTCDELACPYGCKQESTGAVCLPKPPPPVLCLPDQAGWIPSATTGVMSWRVQWALDVYRSEHPEAFEEDGNRLSTHTPAAVDALYDGLGEVLARRSICGGQIRNDGERGDKLGVRNGDEVEAYHLVEYGGFRIQSPIKTESVWRAPVASTECKPPMPLRVYEVDQSPHWFLTCKPWGGAAADIKDCTPKVQGQPDFCEAVFGKRDLNCELGPEANADRECRERYLYGTTRVESRNGASCSMPTGNPMQFAGSGGCRLCSTLEPVVCSEWF